jgi:hypothetical protein
MNRYARDIVYVFGGTQNRKFLAEQLRNFFKNHTVSAFVNEHIHNLVDNFIKSIEEELSVSDPLPGVTVEDQVECFNCQFISDRISYIREHVLSPTPDKYTVSDGMPTSRFGARHHAASADRQLQTWAMNSGRGVQGREDSHGDDSTSTYWGRGDHHMATGIDFCDQSELNTSNHVTQLLGTSYIQGLNRDAQPHTNIAFGNATPASDARLLTRRTFRSNEAGVENGIPRYESRLYVRSHDRDASEALQGRERDCMIHGHDMESLLARVEHKQIVRDKYGAPDIRKMKLQNNRSYHAEADYK